MANLPRVFILVGGLGSRLKSIARNRPKALMETGGVAFLDLQLKWLVRQGIQDVVLLTGHKSEQISHFIEDASSWDLNIKIIRESRPLGTGGAILNALNKLQTNKAFMLLNGDSLLEMSLRKFYESNDSFNLAKLVTVFQADADRFGKVTFDKNFDLLRFEEKNTDSQDGWINAGIYYFPEGWFEFETFTEYPISLEKDLFPIWLSSEKSKSRVYPVKGEFIDIGTPESFNLFKEHTKLWHSKLLH